MDKLILMYYQTKIWNSFRQVRWNVQNLGFRSVYKEQPHLYVCVSAVAVWLEYVQYSIGGMAEEGGLATIRDTFERALTAVGIHVASGSMLWEAYREFECAVLAGLQPTPGSVADSEAVKQIDIQMKRIAKLFQRQLSVPLIGK